MNLLAQVCAGDRFVIFAENFSINLQAVCERLSWRVAVEACFNDLEKRTGAAQFQAAHEAQCARVTRKLRAQKRLHSARQPGLIFILAYLGDRWLRRVLDS